MTAQQASKPNLAYQQKLELFDLQTSLKKRGIFDEAVMIRKLMNGEEIKITPFHQLWIELSNYRFIQQDFEIVGDRGAMVWAYIPINHKYYL